MYFCIIIAFVSILILKQKKTMTDTTELNKIKHWINVKPNNVFSHLVKDIQNSAKSCSQSHNDI